MAYGWRGEWERNFIQLVQLVGRGEGGKAVRHLQRLERRWVCTGVRWEKDGQGLLISTVLFEGVVSDGEVNRVSDDSER